MDLYELDILVNQARKQADEICDRKGSDYWKGLYEGYYRSLIDKRNNDKEMLKMLEALSGIFTTKQRERQFPNIFKKLKVLIEELRGCVGANVF